MSRNPKSTGRWVPYREPRAPHHPPVARLRRVGARPEEIAEARRHWAEMTDDERFEAIAALNHVTDDELREQLHAGRIVDATVERGYPEGGTVDEVLAWVGDDQGRAGFALGRERASTKPRVTLLDQLEVLADGQRDRDA